MTTFSEHIVQWDFETIYTQLRQKEQRVYTDEEIAMLPSVSPDHVHYKEWLLRKESSEKLIEYLKKKNKPLDILEIGCGNGWLSKALSTIPGSQVTGTDINFSEIQQAATVFQNIPNLYFMYTNVETNVFKEKHFNIIVFAASVQYFKSLQETVAIHLKLLKTGGEIHIIDSPFYSLHELEAAKNRTQQYYESAGFVEMANRYFHPCYDDLRSFNYSKHYDPKRWLAKFRLNKNPFPWISIQLTKP